MSLDGSPNSRRSTPWWSQLVLQVGEGTVFGGWEHLVEPLMAFQV
jgi:hypothetical protein